LPGQQARGEHTGRFGGVGGARGVQTRGFCSKKGSISVPVDRDNVERAMMRFNRMLVEEGLVKAAKAKETHMTPSEAKVEARKDRDYRLAKKRLKWKLGWVIRRKTRGF